MALTICSSTIDWAATGAMLQGIGAIGGAGAVAFAAWYATKTWRHQKLAEHKREQAERILNATYVVQDTLERIRGSLIPPDKLQEATRSLASKEASGWRYKTAETQDLLAQGAAYISIVENERADRKILLDCIPIAEAIFSPKNGKLLIMAIRALDHQFQIILHAAHNFGDQPDDNTYTANKRRTMFVIEDGKPDPVKEAIEEAVKTIKSLCTPAMRLEVETKICEI